MRRDLEVQRGQRSIEKDPGSLNGVAAGEREGARSGFGETATPKDTAIENKVESAGDGCRAVEENRIIEGAGSAICRQHSATELQGSTSQHLIASDQQSSIDEVDDVEVVISGQRQLAQAVFDQNSVEDVGGNESAATGGGRDQERAGT